MDYHSLYLKTVAELKTLAKEHGVKIPTGTRKSRMIDLLLASEQPRSEAARPEKNESKAEPSAAQQPAPAKKTRTDTRRTDRKDSRKGSGDEHAAPKAVPPAKTAEPSAAKEVPSAEPAEASAVKAVQPAESAAAAAPRQRGQKLPKRESPTAAVRDEDRPSAGVSAPKEESQAPAANEAKPPQTRPRRTYMFRDDQKEAARQVQPGRRQQSDAAVQARTELSARRRYGISAEESSSQPADGSRQATRQDAQDRGESSAPVYRRREKTPYTQDPTAVNSAVHELLQSSDSADGQGVLELQPDGYGFLRAENYLPGDKDTYVSIAQIRRFGLRNGDFVCGKTRPQREGDRYSALFYITSVNGDPPEKAVNRKQFEDLVPIYPDERIRLENPANEKDLAIRAVDLVAPIGKGQRGLIVSQPKAGKTVLLKKIANAITANYPEIQVIVLLIDERPEEVTDMKRSIDGEVIFSTFDEEPEHHAKVAEMTLDRAQRLVEQGKDVIVLLDSITRLARAYNLVIPPTGRSLSGGLDPGALHKPKRFFGAARNIENGGSLTIIATALVETGSRMDDIIYEEFKGTGNMELHLDRKLSERRIFPAIDMVKSGTRRDDLLLTEAEQEGVLVMRRLLQGNAQDNAEELIGMLEKSPSNAVFIEKLQVLKKNWNMGGYK